MLLYTHKNYYYNSLLYISIINLSYQYKFFFGYSLKNISNKYNVKYYFIDI